MNERADRYRARSVYKNTDYARSYDYTRYHEDKHKRRRDINTQRAITQALGRLTDCKLVLDMPCGTGRLARLVRDAGFSYVGCDLSREMLGICLEKASPGPDLQLVAGDGESLPFGDNSVDCILCVRFLNLIPPEPRLRILKEFNRAASQYLVIASGYFGRARPVADALSRVFAWLFPKIASRHREHAALRNELYEAGWDEHIWIPYRSRGFFSSMKMIGVFKKRVSQDQPFS